MSKKISFIILLAIFSIGIWAQNTPDCIPVVMEVLDQTNQVVVGANNNGAIIAWQDFRDGNYNIYAQRVSDTGVMQWPEYTKGKLISGGTSEKINLAMISDNRGGAIITWQDNRNGNWDIYAQWINSAGDREYPLTWPSTGLAVCTDLSDQSPPVITNNQSGGAFIAWSDNRGGDYDIYVRQIDSIGQLDANVNGKAIQVPAEDQDQLNPAIVADGDNGLMVAFEQIGLTTGKDIYAQRLDANLNTMWTNDLAVTTAAYDQINPKIINDGVTGSAIIIWEDFVNSANSDIYAQRVYEEAAIWQANGVNVHGALAGDQKNPIIIPAGQYKAIIAWESELSATDTNIYAQMLDATPAGTAVTYAWNSGLPVLVGTAHPSFQRNVQGVSDGSGGAIFVYESGENLLDNGYDIYGQRLTSGGIPHDADYPNGYPICTWDTDQSYPMLTYSANTPTKAIYAWRDKRNENDQPGVHDIYTLGVEEAIEYGYLVESHDVTDPDGPDLGAEILLNGESFPVPVYTPYTFGADGNYPIALGVYTVIHDSYDGWVPVSHEITDVNQNDATDFLGIRYVLQITSTPDGQSIFKDAIEDGWLTNGNIFNSDVNALLGTYTLEIAPYGYVWVPTHYIVTESDFNAGNDYTYTIDFVLEIDATLPVELSSFTATVAVGNFVTLQWVTESESNLSGYFVYRGTSSDLGEAIRFPSVIETTNSSQQHTYTYIDQEIYEAGMYYYWLESVEFDGSHTFFGPVSVLVDFIEDDPSAPEIDLVTALNKVFPNPFNPSTFISYTIAEAVPVKINILNSRGQLVRSLLNQSINPGTYTTQWDGRDNKGNSCSSGIYYIRMSAGGDSFIRKALLIK